MVNGYTFREATLTLLAELFKTEARIFLFSGSREIIGQT